MEVVPDKSNGAIETFVPRKSRYVSIVFFAALIVLAVSCCTNEWMKNGLLNAISAVVDVIIRSGILEFDFKYFCYILFGAFICFLIEIFFVGYRNSSLCRIIEAKERSTRIDF